MARMKTHGIKCLAVACFATNATAAAVTWEEQAARLQNISASLIENFPM